jgi:hypothetical protein
MDAGRAGPSSTRASRSSRHPAEPVAKPSRNGRYLRTPAIPAHCRIRESTHRDIRDSGHTFPAKLSANCFIPQLRIRPDAEAQVGTVSTSEGNGADASIVAINRKRRSISA